MCVLAHLFVYAYLGVFVEGKITTSRCPPLDLTFLSDKILYFSLPAEYSSPFSKFVPITLCSTAGEVFFFILSDSSFVLIPAVSST